MTWITLAGLAPEVYALIGPLAMDRAITRELGGPVHTSAGFRWLVGLEAGGLIAFAGVDLTRPDVALLDWSWVRPDARGRGLFTIATERRIALSGERELRASSANPLVQAWYLRRGFTEVRRNGRWHHYRRPHGVA